MKPLPRKDAHRRAVNLGASLVRRGVSSKDAAQILFERYGPHLGARVPFDVERNFFWRGPQLKKFKGLTHEEARKLRRMIHSRFGRFSENFSNEIVGAEPEKKVVQKKSLIERTKKRPLSPGQKEKLRAQKMLALATAKMDKEPHSLFTYAINTMSSIWRDSQIKQFLAIHSISEINRMMRVEVNRLPEKERKVIRGEFFFKMNDREIAANYHLKMGDVPTLRKNGLANIALRIMRQSPAYAPPKKK